MSFAHDLCPEKNVSSTPDRTRHLTQPLVLSLLAILFLPSQFPHSQLPNLIGAPSCIGESLIDRNDLLRPIYPQTKMKSQSFATCGFLNLHCKILSPCPGFHRSILNQNFQRSYASSHNSPRIGSYPDGLNYCLDQTLGFSFISS